MESTLIQRQYQSEIIDIVRTVEYCGAGADMSDVRFLAGRQGICYEKVFPALVQAVQDGLLVVELIDGRKVYRIKKGE